MNVAAEELTETDDQRQNLFCLTPSGTPLSDRNMPLIAQFCQEADVTSGAQTWTEEEPSFDNFQVKLLLLLMHTVHL